MIQKNQAFKLLSVVVPAYKQEKTIVTDIRNIESSLKELGINYEIIVVVDGDVDNTYKNLLTIRSNKIKIIKFKTNQGKGSAVKTGMLAAKGDIVGFIDAGMDISPNSLSLLLNHMLWYNADIIVGSKMHPVSKVQYPLYRRVLSRSYWIMSKLLFGFKIKDTQVGLKFFKKDVVKTVMPLILVKQYAFDIELLAVAQAKGFTKIYEAPVELDFQNNSSITSKNFWKVILHMMWDTLAVYYRLRILHYYDTQTRKNF